MSDGREIAPNNKNNNNSDHRDSICQFKDIRLLRTKRNGLRRTKDDIRLRQHLIDVYIKVTLDRCLAEVEDFAKKIFGGGKHRQKDTQQRLKTSPKNTRQR